MKALLMRSYNKAETVEILKLTKEEVKKIKSIPRIKRFNNNEYEIEQKILFENDKLILREKSTQKTDRFNSKQEIDIYLKENDVLIKTEIGYKVNLLPIREITEKEEKLIEKYNKLDK